MMNIATTTVIKTNAHTQQQQNTPYYGRVMCVCVCVCVCARARARARSASLNNDGVAYKEQPLPLVEMSDTDDIYN